MHIKYSVFIEIDLAYQPCIAILQKLQSQKPNTLDQFKSVKVKIYYASSIMYLPT